MSFEFVSVGKVNDKSEAGNNFNVFILRFPSWLPESHKLLLGVDLRCLAQRRRRLLVMLPPSVSQVTLKGLEGRQEGVG